MIFAEVRWGQRWKIPIYWFCREAFLSSIGYFHQPELSWHLARLTLPITAHRAVTQSAPAASNYILWSSKSAAPQMIFSPASHLIKFSNKPHEVKRCIPKLQSESVAQLCCKIWGHSVFSLPADHMVNSSAIGSASLQRNGIKLLASGFWLLQKHQQQ